MSVKNFESAFRGSSKNTATTLDEIQQLMRLFAARGDAKKLHFSHTILSQMCQAIVAGGTNYELYSDVFMKVLAPNVDPASSPKYWSAFVEMVRYFYFLLCERKLFTVMFQVYDWIATKSNKLQNERDYEFILGIYTQHLMVQKCDFETSSDYSQRMEGICKDLAKLFEGMLEKNRELNFVYSDLLKNIMRFLISKKTHRFIAMASNWSQMFDALFVLMSELRGPQIRLVEAQDLFMDYMSALMHFMAFDALIVGDKCNQVALRYLRTARDLSVFKCHKTMAYALSLLYYFVKFAFCLDSADNASQSYTELCENFRKFFSRNSEALKSEQWFMEFVVVMILLLSQQDIHKSKIFGGAVVNADVIRLHLLLMMDFIKLASSITQTKLMTWTCCTSTRKHVILSLLRAVLKIYTYFATSVQKENVSLTAGEEINRTFSTIMRHSIQVIDSMTCISSTSPELQSFHASFLYLLAKVQFASHVKLCIALTETLLKLQTKFTPQMWMQLFVRLRRAAPLTKEYKIIAEMHAIQIAYMLKLKDVDYSMLLNEIGIFYTTEHLFVWDMCLLEVLETSSSPLKPILDAQEIRLLHTFETQIIYRYQKTNLLLYTSLLKCSPTHLHFVLVSRESKELDTHGKVKRIYKALKRKAEEPNGLKRIEKLTLAHACVTLASEQVENMKKIFDYQQQKEFAEETLALYLINEKIKRIDVSIEMQLIEVILEGVEYFEDFFQTADLEPITSQEMLMDWEAMMSDVSFLARLLQLRGYLEDATKAWLLLYTIANYLDDSNNILRALAFLCEHASFVEQHSDINLVKEISQKQETIVTSLNNIQTLVPRRQNYLLLCLCQMAFLYARQSHFSYAYMLLNLVERKRNELPERRDKFDFIAGSLQAVKFRILWKFMDKSEAITTDSNCLLRQIEATFSSFRGFVYISSEDSINYMILLFGLLQEFSECTVNRLCDSNVKSFFVSILKGALDAGATLRVIQSLTSWAMANLQMERVDKAQSKLEIIECLLGVRNVQELMKTKVSCASQLKIEEAHNSERYKEQLLALQNNPGVEIMRRVAQGHLSPVMKDKLTLSADSNVHRDLQRFFKHDVNEALMKNNFLQWTFITVGWMNARLLFLIEENTQLEQFYRVAKTWCQKEKSQFLLTNFQNMQLMSMQHYLNYLRATKQYSKALGFVEGALSFYGKSERNVDKVYNVNLEVQKRATQYEMLYGDSRRRESLGKLRRVLQFGNLSPEDDKCANGNEKVIKKVNNRFKSRNVRRNNEYEKSLPAVENAATRILNKKPFKQSHYSSVKKDALNNAFIGGISPESDEVTSTTSIHLKSITSDVIEPTLNMGEILQPQPLIELEKVQVDLTASDDDSSPSFSSHQITVIEVNSRNKTPNSVITDETPLRSVVKMQQTAGDSCKTSAKMPKTKYPTSFRKNPKYSNSPQDVGSLIENIEKIHIVDSEDEENISPAVGQTNIVLEKPIKQKSNLTPTLVTNDIVYKMQSLDISPATPSPPNIKIVEIPHLKKKVLRNYMPQTFSTVKCGNGETPTSTETSVKKRGRPKKAGTDVEAIKENNVIERVRMTRRRQLT